MHRSVSRGSSAAIRGSHVAGEEQQHLEQAKAEKDDERQCKCELDQFTAGLVAKQSRAGNEHTASKRHRRVRDRRMGRRLGDHWPETGRTAPDERFTVAGIYGVRKSSGTLTAVVTET